MRANPFQDLDPRDERQLEIEQHKRRQRTRAALRDRIGKIFDRERAVRHAMDWIRKMRFAKRRLQQEHRIFLVFDHENRRRRKHRVESARSENRPQDFARTSPATRRAICTRPSAGKLPAPVSDLRHPPSALRPLSSVPSPAGKPPPNWRCGAESNRRIELLQSSALPLGYRTVTERRVLLRARRSERQAEIT